MSAIIGNLRNVANDINNTVKAQNETLDRIHKKVKHRFPIVLNITWFLDCHISTITLSAYNLVTFIFV